MSEHTAGLLLALLLGPGPVPLPVSVVLLQPVRATARTPAAKSRG
jgi:hypothetical protein